jgi:c-di-GMP-binding flagellar brake protein YcgR
MRERRRARRYDLILPVTIQASTGNDPTSLNGETLDISTRGVYLTVDHDLRVGMKVGLTMRMPNRVAGGMEVLICAIAQVVRVEKRPQKPIRNVGIGAISKRPLFVRYETVGRSGLTSSTR